MPGRKLPLAAKRIKLQGPGDSKTEILHTIGLDHNITGAAGGKLLLRSIRSAHTQLERGFGALAGPFILLPGRRQPGLIRHGFNADQEKADAHHQRDGQANAPRRSVLQSFESGIPRVIHRALALRRGQQCIN